MKSISVPQQVDLPGRRDQLKNLYHDLQCTYQQNGLTALREKCAGEQARSYLNDYKLKKRRLLAKYNPSKHAIDSSTARNYLDLLSDQDRNADLKQLIPVDILNDGSVLFRAVTALLGFSSEDDVLELRVGCLIDVMSNLINYLSNYPTLLTSLLDSEVATQTRWSNLIYEHAQIDAPNVITIVTLISLASLIKIPIRSVYISSPRDKPSNATDHIYTNLNTIFYPPGQQRPAGTMLKPITILWCRTAVDTVLYPNHVIPLLPAEEDSLNKKLSYMSLTKSTVSDMSTTPAVQIKCISPTVKIRGTFILVITTINNNKQDTKVVEQAIEKLKSAVIELLKIVATKAQPCDIIEVYGYDQELSNPPLISSCEADKVATEENFNRIHTLQFSQSSSINILGSISAFLDRIARQSTYYRDVFLFVDNSIINTHDTASENATIQRFREMQSVIVHWILLSDPVSSEEKFFQSLETSRICSLSPANHSNNVRRYITLFYESNHTPQQIEPSESVSTVTGGFEMDVASARTNTTMRYEEHTSATDVKSKQHTASSVKPPRPDNIRHSNNQADAFKNPSKDIKFSLFFR